MLRAFLFKSDVRRRAGEILGAPFELALFTLARTRLFEIGGPCRVLQGPRDRSLIESLLTFLSPEDRVQVQFGVCGFS